MERGAVDASSGEPVERFLEDHISTAANEPDHVRAGNRRLRIYHLFVIRSSASNLISRPL